MPKRHISNNIRLILDMIDYSDLLPNDSFILFIDFYKAFDTIEHNFILKSISFFVFGNYFHKAIQTLYNGCSSSVKLKTGTSERFSISRGIRQGCPVSPFLFLLVAQTMATHIKMSPFSGINAVGKKFQICQLADDTAIFLSDRNQIGTAVNSIKTFSDVSGLVMNINKSVLFPLKNCNLASLDGIPINEKVTYLGIVICKNKEERHKLNFDPIVKKIQSKLNSWLMRDLSLFGRVLIS